MNLLREERKLDGGVPPLLAANVAAEDRPVIVGVDVVARSARTLKRRMVVLFP